MADDGKRRGDPQAAQRRQAAAKELKRRAKAIARELERKARKKKRRQGG